MRADLHIHSNYSDGSDSIHTIMMEAKKCGITHLSVTDHDTTEHCDELADEGKKNGIKTISGIEISAYDFVSNKKVHILGYGFSSNTHIRQVCEKILSQREEATIKKIEILKKNGYTIDIEDVRKANNNPPTLYKQHIMKAFVDQGKATAIYGELYNSLFKNGGICAGDIFYPDYKEAITAITQDGGIAVLAHAAQGPVYDIIPLCVSHGLGGLELYHESHSLSDHKKIFSAADSFNLILTGGSDSHGTLGSLHNVGSITSPHSVFSSKLF